MVRATAAIRPFGYIAKAFNLEQEHDVRFGFFSLQYAYTIKRRLYAPFVGRNRLTSIGNRWRLSIEDTCHSMTPLTSQDSRVKNAGLIIRSFHKLHKS